MKHLETMIEYADKEFGAIEQNGRFRSRDEIDAVYKLMDIVKDAYCIMDMEEGYSEADGYSDRRSYRSGSYDNYNDGGSYARGRGRNAKRDSMGRYASRGSYRYSNNDEYKNQLMELMQNAPDEKTRQSIQRMMDQMDE